MIGFKKCVDSPYGFNELPIVGDVDPISMIADPEAKVVEVCAEMRPEIQTHKLPCKTVQLVFCPS
jgi:hypothetical protein